MDYFNERTYTLTLWYRTPEVVHQIHIQNIWNSQQDEGNNQIPLDR